MGRPLGPLHPPKLSLERCPWRPDLPAGNGAQGPAPPAQIPFAWALTV